jgi:hypothetical protein
MRLEALFRPKSTAIVGASDKPTIGRRLIASLDRIGFAGPIFPINPNYSTVAGRRCYSSVAELPEAPMSRCFGVGHARVLDASPRGGRGVRGCRSDGGLPNAAGTAPATNPDRRDLSRAGGIALWAQLHGSASPTIAARPICRNCATRQVSPAMSASSPRAAQSASAC